MLFSLFFLFIEINKKGFAQDDVDETITTLNDITEDLINTYTSTESFSIQSMENDLQDIFNNLDLDEDGYLNFDEYSNFIYSLGLQSETINAMDLDGDNQVGYNEMIYYLIITNNIEYEQLIRSTYINLLLNVDDYNQIDGWATCVTRIYFNTLDINNDGYLQNDDIINYIYTTAFNMVDVDQNSLIDYNEFTNSYFNVDSISSISQYYTPLIEGLTDFQDIIINVNQDDIKNMEISECSIPLNRRLGDSCGPMILSSIFSWFVAGACCVTLAGAAVGTAVFTAGTSVVGAVAGCVGCTGVAGSLTAVTAASCH